MLKYVALSAAAAIAFAGPVAAADPITVIDHRVLYDAAPASEWTSFYVGAFVGYHAGTIIQYSCTGICSGNFPLQGPAGGITAGADYQMDNGLVIGGYVQVPLVRPTGTTTIGGGIATFTVTPDWALTGGIRLGYAMDMFMPYVHGDVGVTSVTVNNSFTGTNSTATHLGIGGGVGLEVKVTENISLDARYTYASFGAGTYNWGFGASQYGEDSHNFTIGANFRF